MKTLLTALALAVPLNVNGAILFSEDFETDLSQWIGPNGGAHSGSLVVDPLNSANHAIRFAWLSNGADVFSGQTFSSGSGVYHLSFDYLGTCGTGDCGGYVGYNTVPDSVPVEGWLEGTGSNFLVYNTPDFHVMPDTGVWTHMDHTFSAPSNIYLALEDWYGSDDRTPLNAYFDNIVLTDNIPVPIPGALWLFGSAVAIMGVTRRRISRK